MTDQVYLDYAATTPVDPYVKKVMCRYLGTDGVFGNPSSRTHHFGEEAEEAVHRARCDVAELIHASPNEIIWTSGATESINLAIKGATHARREAGRHIVTSALEHKAVLDTCAHLETEGFEVTYIKPNLDGLITSTMVEDALREDTVLVSLMHVNNELGTVTDIAGIGEITRKRGVTFHVDAAQSASRLPLDMNEMQVDLVSMSAHKMYGPKGSGALYVRRRPPTRLTAWLHGGGQERGIRPGTLATHQIAGMGAAARLMAKKRTDDHEHITALCERMIHSFDALGGMDVNGSRLHSVPGIMNVRFDQVDGDTLVMALAARGIAVSTGSACTSTSFDPSHVLLALGIGAERAAQGVRFSIGRFTTDTEIDFVIKETAEAVKELRALATCGLDRTSDQIDRHQVSNGTAMQRATA